MNKVVLYVSRMQDGGAETIVKDYALMLDKNKFDITVVCEDYKKGSANYSILLKNNIKCVYTYGKFDLICRAIARIVGVRFKATLLRRALKQINPDIIHIQLESLDVIRCLSEELKKTKLFFTCQNLPEICIGDKRPKERDACEYLLRNNNLQIFALHEEMAEEINKMFNINNVIVLKNGVDFNKYYNIVESKGEIRKAINVPLDAYVIGHIGRFAPQKNHEMIIDVFKEISAKDEKAHLLLIGDGKLKSKIEEKINNYGLEKKVTILSHRTDIPKLLKSMDVFLFPSLFEGLGIVLIEAQISKLHCVISDKIPKEAIQNMNMTVLPLNEKLNIWANECLHPKGNVTKCGNLDEYDMNNIIKKLEEIYLR